MERIDKLITNQKQFKNLFNPICCVNLQERELIDNLLLKEFGQYFGNSLPKFGSRWKRYPVFEDIEYYVLVMGMINIEVRYKIWKISELKKLCDLTYERYVRSYVISQFLPLNNLFLIESNNSRHALGSNSVNLIILLIESLISGGLIVELRKIILENLLELLIKDCIEINSPYGARNETPIQKLTKKGVSW